MLFTFSSLKPCPGLVVQDLRRHKERDQGIVDELTVSRDECRQHAASLEAKRAELELLLKVYWGGVQPRAAGGGEGGGHAG